MGNCIFPSAHWKFFLSFTPSFPHFIAYTKPHQHATLIYSIVPLFNHAKKRKLVYSFIFLSSGSVFWSRRYSIGRFTMKKRARVAGGRCGGFTEGMGEGVCFLHAKPVFYDALMKPLICCRNTLTFFSLLPFSTTSLVRYRVQSSLPNCIVMLASLSIPPN